MSSTLTRREYVLEPLTDENREFEPTPIFDEFGNPTEETLRAFYESEHGLTTPLTMEELQEWLDEIR